MKALLREAGICNYTIWNVGNELFGYYECKFGVDFAAETQKNSEVVKRWDAYMSDILIMDKDPVTGAQPLLTQVFSFDSLTVRRINHDCLSTDHKHIGRQTFVNTRFHSTAT